MNKTINQTFGAPLLKSGKTWKINQLATAQAFASDYRIFWDQVRQTFTSVHDSDQVFRPLTITTAKSHLTECLQRLASNAKAELSNLSITDKKLSGILEIVKSRSMAPDVTKGRLFPVANGVLDFSGPRIKRLPHDQAYGFRFASPVSWDAKATCPKFKAMLERVLPDRQDRQLLQMYLGAPMTGMNQTRRMLWIHGPAGTSKSTIMSIHRKIFGDYLTGELKTALLTTRFEKSHLLDKRLLIAPDAPADILSVSGAKSLKHMLGGDITQAEVKFGGTESLHGDFFVIITSNGELRINLEGDEEAWIERMLVLDLVGGTLTEKKANFADALVAEEGPGILRWMAEGGRLYLREVEKTGDIKLTTSQLQRIENLVMASKSLEVFVNQKIGFIEGQNLTVDEILRAYSLFCKERGWEPVSSHVLYARLPDLMLHKHGATKSSSINRDDSKRPGYENVILLAQ